MSKHFKWWKKEQKQNQEEWQKRVTDFLEDFKQLEKKHNIAFRPIITQDGPRIIPIDLYAQTTQQNLNNQTQNLPKE